MPDDAVQSADRLSGEGKTPLFFVRDGLFLGMVAVADTLREDSRDAIAALKNMGLKVVMLTGDNLRTARAIGAAAGVHRYLKEAGTAQSQEAAEAVLSQVSGLNPGSKLCQLILGMYVMLLAGADLKALQKAAASITARENPNVI